MALLKIAPLRAGLMGLLSQNLILMGVFFTVPLYLQLVLGYDALETGIKVLPVSVAMFIASALGARLASRFSIRAVVRAGLWIAQLSVLLLASQLGKVVQAPVDASGRGEAGGLQFTGQQLGSSLGVVLIGAVVLSGLTANFVSNIQESPEISQEVASQVSVAVGGGIDFVSSNQIATAAQDVGLDEATTVALVDDCEQAQLKALKAGLLGAAFLALISLPFTRQLPHDGQVLETVAESIST